jgi:toxin YoeB
LTRIERKAVFGSKFREDLYHWTQNDRKIALKVLDLVEVILRDPFEGLGKPEPMRFEFSGCWSRRISAEHRLVYDVASDSINFMQARYHYHD